MYFSRVIRTKVLLPWEAPVQWYLICIIRFMLFICVFLSTICELPLTLCFIQRECFLSERQHFSFVNIYLYLWICIIILYSVLSAYVGTYICAYVSVHACVLPTYVCTYIHELCTCICLILSHAGAVCVCACVCASIWDGMCAIL